MILSHKQIEEIAASVTNDFNEFFFGKDAEVVRFAHATLIDLLARQWFNIAASHRRTRCCICIIQES